MSSDQKSGSWTRIEQVIQGDKPRICDYYSDRFRAAADLEQDGGRKEELSLLAAVCSYHLRPENALEPFGPRMIWEGHRTAIPSDLTADQIKKLKDLLLAVEDPDLQARIADSLWVLRRDHEAALQAISSYLEIGGQLLASTHPAATSRIQRALRIARLLGRDHSANRSTDEVLLERLTDTTLSARVRLDLMELGWEFRIGDPEEMCQLAKSIGESLSAAEDLWEAEGFFELQAKWAARSGATTDRREALIAKAEVLVKISERFDSAMAAASHLEKAVSLLRSVGEYDKADTLHRKLIQVQEGVGDEMGRFSTEVDLRDAIRTAEKHVRGRPWPQVLAYFSGVATIVNPKRLRASVEKQLREHPLLGLISRSTVDASGRVVHQQPPALGGSHEETEMGLWSLMCQQAELERQITTSGQILPAMRVVIREHSFTERQLASVLRQSPVVPLGRETAYGRGLFAGFQGDFLTATHLLLPQLENSIRVLLNSRGVITRSIKEDGTQELFGLGRMLSMEEARALLSEDLVFELRSLLTEPAGPNLRNEALHGLQPDGFYFYEPAVPYLWWLTLRLCIFPLNQESSSEQGQEAPDDEKQGGDEIGGR